MGNLRKLMTEEFGGISKWWLFACLYWNGSFSGATRRRSRPRTLPRRLRSPRPTTSCSHRPARPRLPPPSGSSSKSLETMLFIVNEADFEIRKCRIELKRQAFAEWSDISTSQNKPVSARRVGCGLKIWNDQRSAKFDNFENSAVSYNSIRKSTSRKMHFIMRYFLQSSFEKLEADTCSSSEISYNCYFFKHFAVLNGWRRANDLSSIFPCHHIKTFLFHYEQHLWKHKIDIF